MIVRVNKDIRFLNFLSSATIIVGVPLAIYEFFRLSAPTSDISHMVNFATGLGSASAVILAVNNLLSDNFHKGFIKNNYEKTLEVLKILP